MMEKTNKNYMDILLFFTAILLMGIGISMIYSASAHYTDSSYYVKHQSVYVLLGIITILITSRIKLSLLYEHAGKIILLTIILLFIVFLPWVNRPGLTNRWIELGLFNIQPSEIAKITVIIYLSALISKKEDKLHSLTQGFLPPLMVVGLITALIVLEPDFSTGILVIISAMILFFIGGVPVRFLALLISTLIPLFIVIILVTPFRLGRMMAWLNPEEYKDNYGYHMTKFQEAFANGGFLGVGIGNGEEKAFVPEANTDSIFAVYGEELGLLGCLVILILFMLLIYRGYAIAFRCEQTFHKLLAYGITTLLFIQMIINLAVATGIFPITGLPLPFLSYGGSSLLSLSIGIGLLLNLSRLYPPQKQRAAFAKMA